MIVLVVFLRMFGWGFVDPFYSLFLKTFTDNYTFLGVLGATHSFVSLLTIIPLVRLTDKVRDAKIMMDGEVMYLFAILFYMLAGFSQSLVLLFCAFVLNGIAYPLIIVGAETYIRRHSPEKYTARSFGYYTALLYFGWILAMLLSVFLVPYYSFNTMFLFVIPSIVLSFYILPKIHERGFKSIFRGFRKYFHAKEDFTCIFSNLKTLNPRMYFFLLVSFFDGVIISFLYLFMPLFGSSLGLEFREIPFLLSVMYMPFIFSFFFSEAADRMKKMNVIATGLFIGSVSFILLSFIVAQLWVVVLASMVSFSIAILRPAYNGMITRLTPRVMLGEMTGVNNFSMRLGHVVGPIFMGFIADLYGIQITFFAIAILAFFLGGVALIFRHSPYFCD